MVDLRQWQVEALAIWAEHRKGIVEVVTGGGKTIFALACVREIKAETTLVVVPTIALADQWWSEAATFFDMSLDDVNVVSKKGRVKSGTINIAVINTAAKLQTEGRAKPCFLIVDECHKAATDQFRAALDVPKIAALGLSATPERPYDDGLSQVLVPALGPVIYRYTYREARRDGVIVPFVLNNVVFDLEPENQKEYDGLTRKIARSIQQIGLEAPETLALLLRRARVLNLSKNRIRLTLKLVSAHRGSRTIVFHEDIFACNVIMQVLVEAGVKADVYHSELPLKQRMMALNAYKSGQLDVLVTCRALDEGFNVPETQIGIIAASTATRRQRIQRLGRVLRPVPGKSAAVVYTLVATKPEIRRLQEEEVDLEGVAEVIWSKA